MEKRANSFQTKMLAFVSEFEANIPNAEKENLNVSKVTIGWQIDHSMRVIISVLETISNSNPADYKWKFSLIKNVVFTLNKIPRGKAKAPKTVRNFEEIKAEDLKFLVENAQKSIENSNQISANSCFLHPYFGYLKWKETQKFLLLHTQHHLKIIRDIYL